VTAVIDASVLAKWFVEAEEGTADARRLRPLALFAPDLAIVELTNVLWKKVRRGEFDARFVPRALSALRHANLVLTDSLSLADRAVEIAIELDHAVYDCFYLSLAERQGLPFVTADDHLGRKLAAKPAVSFAEVLNLSQFVAQL
jgi:predicted nucleic acid-binding protein